MTYFKKRLQLDVPVEKLYHWHTLPGAFERLTPPWEAMTLVAAQGEGVEAHKWLKMRMGKTPLHWLARHRVELESRLFVDMQAQGPFAYWQHQHHFHALGAQRSELVDAIEYRLPLAPFSRVAAPFVHQKLERMFAYRHRVTTQDILTHLHYQKVNSSPMKILISGASGLIGSALVPFLTTGGHDVSTLVRHRPHHKNEIQWDIKNQVLDPQSLEGFDAVIHLAGESIMGRWTEEKKARILESRVQSTRLLVNTFKQMTLPPQVFVCSSAVGYYGDRGDLPVSESDAMGDGFLAEVCEAWEAEAQKAAAFTRVVLARTGIVLSGSGGALAQMLLPFQMGVGGTLGSGQQYMSWITLDDILRAFYHCLYTEDLSGAVNFTAPEPVTNKRLTQVLANVLHRPALFQVPGFALQLVMGEMADEMLLSSTRALPNRLVSSGFVFQYPDLKQGLRHVLGK
jgi:uncharacterized protein